MAIFSVLIGGLTGMIVGLISFLVFNASILEAVAIYVSVGVATSLTLVLFATASWQGADAERQRPQAAN